MSSPLNCFIYIGSDYQLGAILPMNVTFSPSDLRLTIPFNVINDTLLEDTETVSLILTPIADQVEGLSVSPAQTLVLLMDDESELYG